ncbi:hypothetical protein KDK_07560 [Dictyobacter kobayashii]|uniref:Uncharacterized protein n=1 Tax=Dictyobacter kobayashii TaxID=2014872 RepID=A0A402ACZ8_9CHLR|nr:hypothetical protein KDK_07560 [Dictyobacter kobayashii]
MIVLLLLLGGGASAAVWFNLPHAAPVHPTTGIQHTPVAQKTAVPTTRPTSAPTHTPTSVPTHTPTQPAKNFPAIVAAYNGTIHNTPAAVDSTMTLTQMRQQQGAISGHLALGPGLQGDGDFTGTVTTDNKIQFLVPGFAGHLPSFSRGRFSAMALLMDRIVVTRIINVIMPMVPGMAAGRLSQTGIMVARWSLRPVLDVWPIPPEIHGLCCEDEYETL